MGPRAGLAALEKSKISSLYWKLNNFWVVKFWPSLSMTKLCQLQFYSGPVFMLNLLF